MMQGAREDRGWVGCFGSGDDLELGEEVSSQPSPVCGGVASWEGFEGSNTVDLERETLHLMDDQRRIGMVETKTIAPAGGPPVTEHRYQLNNHLGSATLEVDQTGAIITYEEYHPFGTTSFHTTNGAAEVTTKRYRYTGKERDDSTGLYYYGARYYAPWLCRWISPDPAGPVDGLNLYVYVSNNPVRKTDPTGLDDEDMCTGQCTMEPEIVTADSPPADEVEATGTAKSEAAIKKTGNKKSSTNQTEDGEQKKTALETTKAIKKIVDKPNEEGESVTADLTGKIKGAKVVNASTGKKDIMIWSGLSNEEAASSLFHEATHVAMGPTKSEAAYLLQEADVRVLEDKFRQRIGLDAKHPAYRNSDGTTNRNAIESHLLGSSFYQRAASDNVGSRPKAKDNWIGAKEVKF